MGKDQKASEQFQVNAVVFVALVRNSGGKREILLQLRQNTSYMPNMYDFSASGKVEPGESASDAAIRESLEEIGVNIEPKDLHFFHVNHNVPENHLKLFFWADTYDGTPYVCEPDKCKLLEWCSEDRLPNNIIPYLHDVIRDWDSGCYYSESI